MKSEIPYVRFIIFPLGLQSVENKVQHKQISLSDVIQNLYSIFSFSSAAFCGYNFKRVATLAGIHKLYYGFHRFLWAFLISEGNGIFLSNYFRVLQSFGYIFLSLLWVTLHYRYNN